MAMKYRAVFTPEKGGKWSVSAPQIRGCRSWGRSLTEARRNIIDAIATNVEVDGGDGDAVRTGAELIEEFDLPAKQVLDDAIEARAVVAKAERMALEKTMKAITALTRRGLSVRDVGELLGLSYQRIQQLKVVQTARGKTAKRASVQDSAATQRRGVKGAAARRSSERRESIA